MANPKASLLEELSADNINILRVRRLCQRHPGLIASAGLRVRIWALLLMGPKYSNADDANIEKTDRDCNEKHVLDVDVSRTRGNMEEFRSDSWRSTLSDILQFLCLKHNIQYKQGMNEILAPFVYIHPPPKGSVLPYTLFEAFLFRYLERYFCLDDSSYLFKAFRLFHTLLVYHDPQLALHLDDNQYPPELYAPQWFLTAYSRSLPIQHVLRLWDIMIAVDDPAFTFFIGLCLLRRLRGDILLADPELIPEVTSKISLAGESDIDSVLSEALVAYKLTPRCLCRCLRLCCVASAELSPVSSAAPSVRTNASSGSTSRVRGVGSDGLDVAMATQSVRSSVMLAPQELIDSIAPIASSAENNVEESDSSIAAAADLSHDGKAKESSAQAERRIPSQQYVIIDIRYIDESDASGAGSIARAVQLEPDFLDRPDAFDAWLQHFDSMRGLHICIVDMPPAKLSGIALWRRILLGEGDGISSSSAKYGSWMGSPVPDSSSSNKNKAPSNSVHKIHQLQVAGEGGHSTAAAASSSGMSGSSNRDPQSAFAEEEERALKDDAQRPAVRLARALQRNAFPYVSVLEGGFPALVDQLIASRGQLEPVVINHDSDLWEKHLVATGRREQMGAKISKQQQQQEAKSRNSAMTSDARYKGSASRTLKFSDLTEKEVLTIAGGVAERLDHANMHAMILDKLKQLEEHTMKPRHR